MTYTLVATLLSADGAALVHSNIWRDTIVERRAMPTSELRAAQPDHVPITAGHSRDELGEIVHMEIDRAGALRAVGVVDGDPHDHGDYLSVGTTSTPDGYQRRDIEIGHVGVVDRTASIGCPPYVTLPGDVRLGTHTMSRDSWALQPLLDRARHSSQQRRLGAPLTVTRAPQHEHRAGNGYSPATLLDDYDDPPVNVSVDRQARTITVVDSALRPGAMRAVLRFDGGHEPVGVRIDTQQRGRATFRLARTLGADEAIELADSEMRLLYGHVRTFVTGRVEVELSSVPT